MFIKSSRTAKKIVLEVIFENVKIILASTYLDINRQLEDGVLKIVAIIQHAKGECILIAMESNSRYTTWHDTLTKKEAEFLKNSSLAKCFIY